MKKSKEFPYVEPIDYFPKETRKKYKIGEYAEDDDDTNVNQKSRDNVNGKDEE